MLEQKDPLPSAELEIPARDRDRLARPGQDHSQMAGHVVGTFGGMHEIILILRHEALEERMQIRPRRAVGIFINDKTRARVLDKHRAQARCDAALMQHSGDLLRDLVGPLASGADGKRRSVRFHRRPASTTPALTGKPASLKDSRIAASLLRDFAPLS